MLKSSVFLVVLLVAAVSALSAVHPERARAHMPSASIESDVLNGDQAQHVWLQMMHAIVTSNMTALADVCDDNMTFIVEGWAPNNERAPDACWPRGKDAFVAHVSGFVSLFNLSTAWVNQQMAAYDTVFVDVGFAFVSSTRAQMTVAPQTFQILQIVKSADGKWRIGYFLEIGSWHNSNRTQLMTNTWLTIANAISTKNASQFEPFLAPNMTAIAYTLGANISTPWVNRSTFVGEVYGRWKIQAFGNFVTAHTYASCRFVWATATFPWIDVAGNPYVYRMMVMLELAYEDLSNDIPIVTKWIQIKDMGPQNPFAVPRPIPDPR